MNKTTLLKTIVFALIALSLSACETFKSRELNNKKSLNSEKSLPIVMQLTHSYLPNSLHGKALPVLR